MATRSKGRGTAAVFGMLLVLAGVAGAAVLWVMAMQRPARAVDAFARGPVGCTVTLEFTDTGTFYLYRESVPSDHPVFRTCAAVAEDQPFSAELFDGDRGIATRVDESIVYDVDGVEGRSVERVEITAPGRFRLVVVGDDPLTVAAVGRDPDEGVADLQRGAIAVGAVGVVLGAALLLLAGRRSKRARALPTVAVEVPRVADVAWPPQPPRIDQASMPPEPTKPPEGSPWAPPSAADRVSPPSPG